MPKQKQAEASGQPDKLVTSRVGRYLTKHVSYIRAGLGGGGPPADGPIVDTAEQVYISSLALLKMLKHGRAGVPMEVMGLMLGEFVDDYTVRVIDVFAMPQSGTVSFFCHNILKLMVR
jgi:hypothetical protein